nr:caspase family protein [Bacteroidales bacterium]
MKKTSVLLFLLAFAVFPAMSQLYNPYAKWSFELRELPDNEVELQFHLKLEKDWEIYSQNNDPSGPVTWFSFSENSSYILAGKVKEPEPYIRKDDIFGTEIRYFTNSVVYSQRIRRNTSSAFEVRGNIEYQLARNGQTIAPEEYRFVFKVPAAQNHPVATGKSESVGGFVDLGLPSGTLWKYKNETDRDMAAQNTTPAPQPGQQPKQSDADVNIPTGGVTNSSTYAFIIANENYPNREVPYALNDGRIFAEYCNKTLGIQQNHIKVYENATAGQIMACVSSVKKASVANDGNINVIFYYAGHAFPDENTKDAYLMPVDGDSKLVETCYSLKRLYKSLGECGAKSVVCFLDACFSGATREDDMLLTGRGVAIKPKEETPQGNLVVFTSASGAETAHQYEEKGHGLFTYFLLKKLQETNGATTLGDLYDYLSKNV